MQVQDKVIVVTGAGNGIGRELTLLLLNKGARVAAVDINAEALQETAALAGEKQAYLSTHIVNIADRENVEALPADVIEAHGAVDGIINNAGIIQPFVRINDLDYETIHRIFNVNLFGPMYMIKSFLPLLLERPEAHIANVSSMGGFLPVPGQAVYGASKAAIKLLTEGLYAELMDTNVGVTVIFPGAIGTNIAVNSGVMSASDAAAAAEAGQGQQTTPPSVAAQKIVGGIENNSYRVLIGQDAEMMDNLYRQDPQSAVKIIQEQMKALLG
jgi:short-subunit dehydrogenase